jgi:aminopeptidase N
VHVAPVAVVCTSPCDFAGMDLYFQRHDGRAVTCEDFVEAFGDANAGHPVLGRGMMSQFMQWYVGLRGDAATGAHSRIYRRDRVSHSHSVVTVCAVLVVTPTRARCDRYQQAGTPKVTVTSSFDAAAGTFTLSFKQLNPAVGSREMDAKSAASASGKRFNKLPLHIPVRLGLLNRADGSPMDLSSVPQSSDVTVDADGGSLVFHLKKGAQDLVFKGIRDAPVVSLLRQFSAPVELHHANERDAGASPCV